MPGSVLVTKSLTLGVYNLVRRHRNMNKQYKSFWMVVSTVKKITVIAQAHPQWEDYFPQSDDQKRYLQVNET